MVDAALAYAEKGISVFPVTRKDKKPIPPRDRDADGVPIPGTGGHKKATVRRRTIRRWWKQNPNAMIGVPMGELSGVFIADVDTPEGGHDDGVSGWKQLTAEHGEIVTREHCSASGGPHHVFKYDKKSGIRLQTGTLPPGIHIKGEGGYVVVPPSRRLNGEPYTVVRDIDPVDAPEWLVEHIVGKRKKKAAPLKEYTGQVTADYDDVAEAMEFIANPDLSYKIWSDWSLRIFAATSGQGFDIFDTFSRKSTKYNEARTRERWEEAAGSPPSRTGADVIFRQARARGWLAKAKNVPSLLPGFVTPEVARAEATSHIQRFLENVACPVDPDFPTRHHFMNYGNRLRKEEGIPLVIGMAIDPGTGKTEIAIREMAKWLPRVKLDGPVLYTVPRHELGSEIVARFTKYGIDARQFRGREQPNPEKPDESMCLNGPAVDLAIDFHASVADTCCRRNEKTKCVFFDRCAYQGQVPEVTPQVWVVAADCIVHANDLLGVPAVVIVDERFHRIGLSDLRLRSTPLSGLAKRRKFKERDYFDPEVEPVIRRDSLRRRLAEALGLQKEDGGVERQTIAGFSIAECNAAISLEYQLEPKCPMIPGMSRGEVRKIRGENGHAIAEITRSRLLVRVWEEIRTMLERPDITVSGRLSLWPNKDGGRDIAWRGLMEICKQFQQPTLLTDAVLPDEAILRVYYPQVKVIPPIRVATPPSVRVTQVLYAPVSSTKFDSPRHVADLRQYILQRGAECGRGPTLVITQLKLEDELKKAGMPESVSIEHFNNISGIDRYRDVRLLIVIGRTAPGPAVVETDAGVLSGQQPVQLRSDDAFTWYKRRPRAIELRSGEAIKTTGDYHPDPMAEAIRWLVHEGELVQAIGRGRAVNRSKSNPLDVYLLFDTALPMIVDEVVAWEKASPGRARERHRTDVARRHGARLS